MMEFFWQRKDKQSADALQVMCGATPLNLLAKEKYYKYKVRVGEAFLYEDFVYNRNIRKSLAYRRL